MSKKKKSNKINLERGLERVYLKEGQIIGNSGYTDLIVVNGGRDYKLHSTEGGDLDYYDENTSSHHEVRFDLDGTRKTNPNYGRMYYYKR
jgi:hypothetical protein